MPQSWLFSCPFYLLYTSYWFSMSRIRVSTVYFVWFSDLWRTTMRLQATLLSAYMSIFTIADLRYCHLLWYGSLLITLHSGVFFLWNSMVFSCIFFLGYDVFHLLIETTRWCEYSVTRDKSDQSGNISNRWNSVSWVFNCFLYWLVALCTYVFLISANCPV